MPVPKSGKYGERERNEKKKKAMVAAESDESSSSSSDEEALICMERRAEKSNHEDRWTMSEDDTLYLMAKDDSDQEVTSQTSCSSSCESIPTSENLFDQFKKIMEDFEEISLKHSSLTEENKLLSEENLKLTEGQKSQLSEITQLKAENESLSKKVKSLNKELGILKPKEAVDKLLETTKHKGREGLGFDPSSSKRKGRTTFIPPKPTVKTNKKKGKEKEKPTEVPKKFCDKGYSLEFCKDMASLKNISTDEVVLTGKRIRNIYEVIWDDVKEACLISKGWFGQNKGKKGKRFVMGFKGLGFRFHGPKHIKVGLYGFGSSNNDVGQCTNAIEPRLKFHKNLEQQYKHLYIHVQPKPKENAFGRKFLDSTVEQRCQATFHPSRPSQNSDVQVMNIDVGT
ncbi:unnamed protein product [Cuscuta campestris]|uniref:Uncharacterized protein n=1 Tax=Cuscuta campestris TaxID=132261 RepID=A0A484NC20_9ASTE|nr:unnamed protein product [Cuscuta campestris]